MMWDFILRLFVAGILGAVVGLDREYRAKEAGYRTHFLVSLGSALIMVVSQYGFQDVILENSVSLDPSRVAAQVVSEKGFLLVSYDMKRLGHQEKDEYVVSIVLKARKNTEESPLLLLMEQFPEVTVERIE